MCLTESADEARGAVLHGAAVDRGASLYAVWQSAQCFVGKPLS